MNMGAHWMVGASRDPPFGPEIEKKGRVERIDCATTKSLWPITVPPKETNKTFQWPKHKIRMKVNEIEFLKLCNLFPENYLNNLRGKKIGIHPRVTWFHARTGRRSGDLHLNVLISIDIFPRRKEDEFAQAVQIGGLSID